jgi:hypothetical protein
MQPEQRRCAGTTVLRSRNECHCLSTPARWTRARAPESTLQHSSIHPEPQRRCILHSRLSCSNSGCSGYRLIVRQQPKRARMIGASGEDLCLVHAGLDVHYLTPFACASHCQPPTHRPTCHCSGRFPASGGCNRQCFHGNTVASVSVCVRGPR